jgi:hypothetical protein
LTTANSEYRVLDVVSSPWSPLADVSPAPASRLEEQPVFHDLDKQMYGTAPIQLKNQSTKQETRAQIATNPLPWAHTFQ